MKEKFAVNKQWKNKLPMNNIVLMAIVHSRQDLFHGGSGLFFSEISHGGDFIKEFTSIVKFTDNIESFSILIEFNDLHNVGVILLKVSFET